MRALAGSGLTLLSLLALCGCLAPDPLASDVAPGAERDPIDSRSRAAPPTHGVSTPASPLGAPPVAPPVMQPAHVGPDADEPVRMPVVAPDPDNDGAEIDAGHDAAIDPPARPSCATGDAATFAGDFDDLQASIRMLESVTHVTGNLALHDGSFPLPCLERVDGDLMISVTTSPLGLDHLESVGGSLIVDSGNSMAFSSISGLSGLQSVGADLRLLNGWSVESLHGLEQLRSVGGDFVFDAAVSLGDLSALASLTRIGGTLELVGTTDSLFSSLHGLEA